VLTARRPNARLAVFCRRHGLVLVRISAPGTGTPAGADVDADPNWIDVRLAGDGPAAALRALAANPALTVIVRPDRVVAAAALRHRLPPLPWHTRLPANPDPAGPLPG
jgi:hypothetical protein